MRPQGQSPVRLFNGHLTCSYSTPVICAPSTPVVQYYYSVWVLVLDKNDLLLAHVRSTAFSALANAQPELKPVRC
jgi:hypothetical protein